jgi:hypothetical protein
MAKKRKCRYTPEEQNIHEEAVKLRKMTDAQLVDAFNSARMAARAPRMAQNAVKEHTSTNDTSDVEKLLRALSEGKCKGVGGGTSYKIIEFARKMGLIA